MIEPWWPLAVLALIQFGDGVLCLKPVEFIRQCLIDVGFPRQYWWVIPVLKFAATGGLVVGIWWPPLAITTCAALVLYFVLAVGSHIRARDFGRNLFLNASAMLVICTGALVFTVAA